METGTVSEGELECIIDSVVQALEDDADVYRVTDEDDDEVTIETIDGDLYTVKIAKVEPPE
jgi:hypothetical protein